MNAFLFTSALLASFVNGNVVPRDAPGTLFIPMPTQATPFTSDVPSCGTVSGFRVIGVPTEPFVPGVKTIFLPPQASATSTTIFDTSLNATQVVIATPREGTCEEFSIPPQTGASATPTPTLEVCPANGCQATVSQAGQSVMEAINKVTLLSQNLQPAARLVGGSSSMRYNQVPADTIPNIVSGLSQITLTLNMALPRIAALPPLPPGCESDAMVIALVQFVRVHQALLNILIGHAELPSTGPVVAEGHAPDGAALFRRVLKRTSKHEESALGGRAVASALRGVEGAVDCTASALIRLIPTRSECVRQQKACIDGALQEAISAYEK